jgi:hypothetical protein
VVLTSHQPGCLTHTHTQLDSWGRRG